MIIDRIVNINDVDNFQNQNNIPLLVLIRHGESRAPEGKLYGQLDVPLHSSGIRKLRDGGHILSSIISKILYNNKGVVHPCLHSDLERCANTALIINEEIRKEMGIEMSLIALSALREMHVGDWEDMYLDHVFEQVIYYVEAHKKNPHHAKPPGEKAESSHMVRKRVLPIIKHHFEYLEEKNHFLHPHLSELDHLKCFDAWLHELLQYPVNVNVHVWIVHEGSAHAILKLLNVSCWEQNAKAEFLEDVHQNFFKRGDLMILRPRFVPDVLHPQNGFSVFPTKQWEVIYKLAA